MEQLLSTLTFISLYGVSYGVVLFMISVGLVVTMGLMGVVNLAHCAFAAVGGYVAATLMSDAGLTYWSAVPLSAVVVAVLSLIVERVFYTRLYKASELDQVLTTVGIAFLVVASLNLFFGPGVVAPRLPPELTSNIDLGFRRIQGYRLFVIAVGAVLVLVLWFLLDRTTFGARLRATVDNRSMAQATGINADRLFLAAFALGSGLAALGGALGVGVLPLEPMYPFKYLTLALVVFALAGGGIKASAAVALLIGIVDTAGRYLFPAFGAFFIYVLLIALLLWRREGLFGRRKA